MNSAAHSRRDVPANRGFQHGRRASRVDAAAVAGGSVATNNAVGHVDRGDGDPSARSARVLPPTVPRIRVAVVPQSPPPPDAAMFASRRVSVSVAESHQIPPPSAARVSLLTVLPVNVAMMTNTAPPFPPPAALASTVLFVNVAVPPAMPPPPLLEARLLLTVLPVMLMARA